MPSNEYYLVTIEEEKVAFVSIGPVIGNRNRKMIHRLVVLPPWQGLGIGRAIMFFLAEFFDKRKQSLIIKSSQHDFIKSLIKSGLYHAPSKKRRDGITRRDDCTSSAVHASPEVKPFRYSGARQLRFKF